MVSFLLSVTLSGEDSFFNLSRGDSSPLNGCLLFAAKGLVTTDGSSFELCVDGLTGLLSVTGSEEDSLLWPLAVIDSPLGGMRLAATALAD